MFRIVIPIDFLITLVLLVGIILSLLIFIIIDKFKNKNGKKEESNIKKQEIMRLKFK